MFVNLLPISFDIWYKVKVEWRISDHRERYTINDGTPSDWFVSGGIQNWNNIDTLRLRAPNVGNVSMFWDTLSSPVTSSYLSSSIANVFSFTGYVPGTYNLQATACDPFNLCSSLTAPIHVFGSPCQP